MAASAPTLQLELGSALYRLERLGLLGQGWRLVRLLGKGRGAPYEVRRLVDGRLVCNCPDARYRGGGTCKHTVALVEVGLLPAPPEPLTD